VETIATSRSGRVQGERRDGVSVFRGIPFAAPPVAERRWQAPDHERTWNGVRPASAFGPVAAQGQMMLEQLMGGEEPVQSEDCLTLNVWTPSLDGRRPVMVWIHGGAFMFGSGQTPWYDGSQFARHGDVVLVTINYRLGPFGFLELGDLFDGFAASGNLGILDQVAALEWVRDSIAGFGGDPDDVTIFGESAGAGSVGTLLGTPAAGGLFRKAILQSGGASWGRPRDYATDLARQVIDHLGVAPGDTASLLALSTDAINEAGTVLGGEVTSARLPWAPTHDGFVLPQPPLDAIAAGSSAGVHVLAGTNLDEMTLFSFIDPSLAGIGEEGVVTRMHGWDATLDGRTLLDTYRDSRPNATYPDLWVAMSSDAVFRIPSIRLMEEHLAHAPGWMYLFTWPTPVFGGMLRSTHAVEIPFVFDNFDQPGTAMFTGEGAERQGIADRMHAAWIAFARHGDPNHPGIPEWPRYDLERRPTMQIDVDWELLHDPMDAERKLWEHQLA